MNEHIEVLDVGNRPIIKNFNGQIVQNREFLQQMQTQSCMTIPKWALQAFAWAGIVAGGVGAVIGVAATGTIFGAPAGIVLAALSVGAGTTYSFLLWVIDNQVPSSGLVVCW